MNAGWSFDAHIGKPQDPAILEALRTYATPSKGNLRVPDRCKPTETELVEHPDQEETLRGNTGKVMFSSRRDAEAFGKAVAGQRGDDLEPYYCERGHWHVRNVKKNRHVQGWRYDQSQ